MDEAMYYEAEESTSPESEESGEMELETALLPKSFLAGKKVGDTITLKVVHEYDDEIEVGAAGESTEKPEMTVDEEIDMIASRNG